jgi:S-adenosylmethionine:tRNA ribosyltransferase-isomerase
MTERNFTTADFDYALPEQLIAQSPQSERGQSRMLVVDRSAPGEAGRFFDTRFGEITRLIPPGDLLVVNSTRVRHARLLGKRPGGEPAEVLLLHPLDQGEWLAMGKPGRALQPGKQVILGPDSSIEVLGIDDEGFRRVRFLGLDAAVAIDRYGQLPLPPYITRSPTDTDESRYQTVYAEREGSVAAPTAGLHFTHELLESLRTGGVEITSLDLEVGPGTFRPVEVDDPTEHPMHPERFEIPAAAAIAIADARRRGAAVWAVGTTVVRALESAALDDRTVAPGRAETRLMITPGYRFRVVDHLLTNFHLPRSTLLMLVSAFAGHELTMAAYRHAVAERYRFYSYGDAMCIL